MLRKITIVQCRTGRRLRTEEILLIFRQKPDFIILPEYHGVDPLWQDVRHNAAQIQNHRLYWQNLSDYLETALISGTAIELDADRFYNTAHIFSHGRLIGQYRKINPTDNERRHGISPGTSPGVFEINGVRFSILICADVLQPENFTRLAALKPDIIFIPTTSPLKPAETIREKHLRDENIFTAGARAAGSFVVKCCAVGCLWGGHLQGRSLVAAPWGLLTRIPPADEDSERLLSIVLDISELREFRAKIGRHVSCKS